jgi:hypothetical protein
MKHALLMILALSVALVAVGCGGGGAAKTPKETVLNMCDALKDGKESAFMACFDATDKQEKMLGAMFDMMQATMAFSDAVEDALGEEGVKAVLGEESDFDELLDIGADDLEVVEEGDTATVSRKDDAQDPLTLVRKDGKWYIDPEGMIGGDEEPTDEELEENLKQIEAMVKIYEDMAEKAGEEGMTAEKLKMELTQAMMAAFTGDE